MAYEFISMNIPMLCCILQDIPECKWDTLQWALREGFKLAAQLWITRLSSRGESGKVQRMLSALRKRASEMDSASEVRPSSSSMPSTL